jgi:hypothetical protein
MYAHMLLGLYGSKSSSSILGSLKSYKSVYSYILISLLVFELVAVSHSASLRRPSYGCTCTKTKRKRPHKDISFLVVTYSIKIKI